MNEQRGSRTGAVVGASQIGWPCMACMNFLSLIGGEAAKVVLFGSRNDPAAVFQSSYRINKRAQGGCAVFTGAFNGSTRQRPTL